MNISLQFLGASGTVTGSKYLLSCGADKVLIDCGMFQGERRWREENWKPLGVELSEVKAVLLTHAHIDHVGMLPKFYAEGLRCPVYATPPTIELSRLLLLDSAHLQEEEALYRNEKGRSRHMPARPLYTTEDATESLSLFRTIQFHKPHTILPGLTATWRRMGHILGAGSIELQCEDQRIVFSGDIGRYTVPILCDPEPVQFGDTLLIESTYGDKVHDNRDPKDLLAPIINETVQRGGVLLIPSFAVGRTQLLLFYLRELKLKGAIPDIPVIIDSPMASDATELYRRFPSDFDEASMKLHTQGIEPFSVPKMYFTRDREESKKLNQIVEPMILISASGMLSGGRILHHLKHRISSPKNTILFVGHQPAGGRGDWIKKGNPSLTLLGEEVSIRAHIREISGLSAHGDRNELLRWCNESKGTPRKVYVVHGDPIQAESFAETLRKEKHWNVQVAQYREIVSC